MADDVPPPAWVILANHCSAIRFSFDHGHASVMDFRVFSVAQSTDKDGATRWELSSHGSEFHALNQWQEAFCEIDGGLKWDGCINWQTNPECMMHGCGPSHVDDITAIFQTVYHVGKRHMDLLDDPVPEMPEGAVEVAEPEMEVA